MKKPNLRVNINNFVVDDGARGKCSACKSFHFETVLISNQPYCRFCQEEKFPDSTAKFEKSDAKFHCPVSCGAEDLSFDEFFIGRCCVKASRWRSSVKVFQNWYTQKIYLESREQEGDAEVKAETADEKVETCRKAFEDAEKALEDAEKEAKDAHDELKNKKKWRKAVQKRALLTSKRAMKEDNSDIESESEPKDGESCSVCFEIYGEDDRQKAVVIPCGHQACFGCLSSPSLKTCPSCRADFTMDRVFKLFPSSQN